MKRPERTLKGLAESSTILALLISARLAYAEPNEPVQVTARAMLTNGAIYFEDRSTVPPGIGPLGLNLSPSPSTNFLALSGYERVPDTHGTTGRDHVMTILNTGVSVQTKSGITILTNALADFWGITNVPLDTVFDPRIIYDPFHDRWIAVAVAYHATTNAEVLYWFSVNVSFAAEA